MAASVPKNPTNWDEYQYGTSPGQGSVHSSTSHVHFEHTGTPSAADSGDHLHAPDGRAMAGNNLRHRRSVIHGQQTHAFELIWPRYSSSISMRIGSFVQAGGVNSIENFACSWQRAAGFVEITPSTASFTVSEDDDESPTDFRRTDEERGGPGRSLLRAQMENQSTSAIVDDDDEQPDRSEGQSSDSKPLLADTPLVESQFGPGYEPNYGTLTSRVNESSLHHAARLFRDQQSSGMIEADKDREPLLVRRVEQDGKIINVVVGQSTLPQTIFNSVNVLIGVGLLSLPLGVRYAGWLVGLLFFLFSAVTTAYTAKILAKCLDVDDSLITFADIAYVSFGSKARIATSILFSVELIAACVALVVLFADSLDALIPGWGPSFWKVVCGVILVPSGFLPLRILSFTSILGIVCCFGSMYDPLKWFLFVRLMVSSSRDNYLRGRADKATYPRVTERAG